MCEQCRAKTIDWLIALLAGDSAGAALLAPDLDGCGGALTEILRDIRPFVAGPRPTDDAQLEALSSALTATVMRVSEAPAGIRQLYNIAMLSHTFAEAFRRIEYITQAAIVGHAMAGNAEAQAHVSIVEVETAMPAMVRGTQPPVS